MSANAPPTEWSFHSHCPDDTRQVGFALGQVAGPGTVVALIGPLGAGKTLFTRAVAEGLDTPDPRIVNSPTFVLLQEYAGRLPMYHFDTYRLDHPRQFAQLGPEEYFDADGVCLIEWADRVPDVLPDDRLELRIEVSGENLRMLRFRATGERSQGLLARLAARLASA